MHYIYCFKNKINGHKYIGQTNNLTVRYAAHKSQSYNPNSKDYDCLFHKKIRQYGLENFEFYVLEEITEEDLDYVDFREQFWIEHEESWARYGKGYNEKTGGKQFKKSIKLTDEEIMQIKKLLKTSNKSFTDIAYEFNTYRNCISFINNGRYGYDDKEFYPIRQTREWREIPQEVKQEIALLLRDSKISYKELMIRFNVSEHFLVELNNGRSNLKGDFIFPLRKANQKLTSEQENIIYEGLLSKKKISDIALEAGVSKDTVSRRKKKYNI